MGFGFQSGGGVVPAKRRGSAVVRKEAQNAVALLLITSCCALLHLAAATDTQFAVNNTALNLGQSGGSRFQSDVGDDQAVSILQFAKQFIIRALSSSPEKPISLVTLIVENIDGLASTAGGDVPNTANIHLSQNWVAQTSPGDSAGLVTAFKGVLVHECTHVWQNNNGNSNSDTHFGGVIEGIADYVRLTAGYPDSSWVKQAGGNWYDGYSTTAFFLQWIDQNVLSGFVDRLNYDMINPWTDQYFQDLTGKTVGELWQEYQSSLTQAPPSGGRRRALAVATT